MSRRRRGGTPSGPGSDAKPTPEPTPLPAPAGDGAAPGHASTNGLSAPTGAGGPNTRRGQLSPLNTKPVAPVVSPHAGGGRRASPAARGTPPARRRRRDRKGSQPAKLEPGNSDGLADSDSKAAPPTPTAGSTAVLELPPKARASLARAARRKAARIRRAKGQPVLGGGGGGGDGGGAAPVGVRVGVSRTQSKWGLAPAQLARVQSPNSANGSPRRGGRIKGAFSFLKRKLSSKRAIQPMLGAELTDAAMVDDNDEGNADRLAELRRKQRAVAMALSGVTALYEGQQFRAKVLGQSAANATTAKRNKMGKYMLHPLGLFVSSWESLFLCFLFYVTVRVPFFIAFTRTSEWYTEVGDFLSTCFFICDIVVSFRTCYVDEGELVGDPWEVARHYAKGWFAYDLIASLPYTWMFPDVQPVRLMLLLRLVRLAKLEVVMDKVARKWDVGEIMQLWLRVITLGFYITISGHISGCAWFYIASKIESHSEDSWTTLYGIDADTDIQVQYMSSVYWAFTTLTTVGYGDITAHTQWERGFSVIMLMAGAAVFAMLVGKMSALSSERNARVIELRKRQSLLDEFLRQTNLPKALRVRVREYSEFLTRKHKFLSEKALLEDLSPALRRAVNRHVNSDILDSVPVFKFGSSAFRTTMAQTLSPVLGVKGEFIITAEDVIREMYFVKQGTVQLVNKAGYVLLTLRGGSFFGEAAVLDSRPARMSVYAVTECELFMLTKEALNDVLQDFPEFETTLRKLGELRNANFQQPKPGDKRIEPPSGFGSWKEVTQSSNFTRFYNDQLQQSRRQQAARYNPRPRRVDAVRLPGVLKPMIDVIANHAHDAWAKAKVDAGWTYGTTRNAAHQTHPFLVAYSQLPEEAKSSGRHFAEYVLKYLTLLDYRVVKRVAVDLQGNPVDDHADFRWLFGLSVPDDQTFQPRPFPVEQVDLPEGIVGAVEGIAVELHKYWARKKLDAGWTWGQRNNDSLKRDSGLVPWEYMTEVEREQNRATVEAALKLLVGYEFQFQHKRSVLVGRTRFLKIKSPRRRSSSDLSDASGMSPVARPAAAGGAATGLFTVAEGTELQVQTDGGAAGGGGGGGSSGAAHTTVNAVDPVVRQRLEALEAMVGNLSQKMDVLLRREYVMKAVPVPASARSAGTAGAAALDPDVHSFDSNDAD